MKAISLGVIACITWLVTGCGDLDNGSSRRAGLGADQQNVTSSNDHHASAIDSLALGPACGDGNLDPGEQCDDGNTADHDGCSAACTLELVTQFSFTGAAGTEVTFAANIADPELAITPVMSRGAGITPSSATDAFSASGWTTGTAIDPGDFYSFTVAPAAGTAMNLRALQLDERRSATGIRSWSVRSSLDGFASDIAVFTVPDDTLTRTETASLPIQFHNLTTAVEFRIFGLQAEAATGTWRVDNVTLIGGVAPTCGNGIVDPGEQCDDGNTANGDGCENNCTLPACGNGIVDAGEQCDDGNLANHDGCSAACTLELVTQFSFTGAAGNEVTFAADIADPELAITPVMSRGAGITPSSATDAFSASGWTTGTAIDPGDFYSFTVAPAAGAAMNLRALQLDERRSATGIRSWSVRSSLDGFASDIAVFTVPDDTLTRTETAPLPIQFHNLTTAVEFRIFGLQAEAATGTWRVDNVTLIGGVAPTCGNGIVDPGEQCDDGNTANGDGCENNCTLPACGNGIVDPGEQCDDGNTANGDGCENNCTLPACGNGIVDPGEQCDDANTANGDGCENNGSSGNVWHNAA